MKQWGNISHTGQQLSAVYMNVYTDWCERARAALEKETP